MNRYKIFDFIESYGDGIHGTPRYSTTGEYYFINGNNLSENGVDYTNALKIDFDEYNRIKKNLSTDCILVSINGTLGKISFYNKEKIALGKSICFLNIKKTKDKYFLKYVLSTKQFKKYLYTVATGSTIKNISPSQIVDYEFLAPEEQEHNKIGHLLFDIDSKITLNNKINDNLQQQAKLLYDYWFNQFEFPNEEGKPYKSSGGKMVWNEELKREIPEGWEAKKILDTDIYVSDYTANGSFKGLADNVKYGEGMPYAMLIRIIDFNNNFEKESDHVWINKHGYDYLSKSNLYGDEIIICNVGAAGNVYRCPRLKCPMTLGPNGIVVNHEYLNNYLELYFSSAIGQHQLHSISSGSIQLKFNKTNFRDLYIPIPSKSIIDDFYKTYNVIYEQKNSIWNENRKLSSLRDWLLPMLMNGQATVED